IWDEQEIASLRLLTNSLSSVLSNYQLRIELERKNLQLESAIRGSKDSLWDYDVRKEKIYYSPQFLEMLGYQENELEGTLSDLDKIVHPKDLYKIFKGLQYVVNSGQEINGFEIRLLTKNQELLWIRVSAKPSTDLRGNTLRISGSNTNITLEKIYESKIAESQEKYIELVDNLREIVFQINFSGNIIFLNEAWHILSGFNVSSSVGKPFSEFIVEEDRSKFDELLKHLQQNKNAYLSCLVRIAQKKSDTITWAEIYARSFNKKGNEPYILGTIIDVSQRQITEQKLKDSEMRYRLISENLSDLVTLQDELGHFIYVSPSVKNILGLNPDSMLNKTPRQIWPAEILKDTSWERDLFDPKQQSRKSYRFPRENNEEIWLETLRTLVYTDDGDRFIIQSTTRDISAFKEAEQNLKTALDKQRELNELKSNFISMASHEFRTPLTTIRSSMQLLEEYGKSAPEEQKLKMEKHYARIKEQIERVTRLMNDVLTLGKFDAGKTPFHAVPSNIVRFCEELVADHFMNMNDGREISIQVKGQVKPVSFDTSLMTHVLLNLIANAFKYSANRPNPRLEIEFDTDIVRLGIRDFGIGIPPDDINLVFQTFYRAKNAIEVPGTGLGLVITKEFVELHKGRISIESRLNKETLVTVELPID
ncbi:MAG: sensor histidine kinase, partial [Bacteroidia bacterium]